MQQQHHPLRPSKRPPANRYNVLSLFVTFTLSGAVAAQAAPTAVLAPVSAPLQQQTAMQAVPKHANDPTVLKAPVEPLPAALLKQKLQEDQAFLLHSQQHLQHNDVTELQAARSLQVAAAANCDSLLSGYGSKTGQALVDHILSSPNECINDLFSGNATAIAAFSANNMQAVANATATLASSYNASGSEVTLGKLYYFLRAGYYVQYYNPNKIPAYPSWVGTAVRSALDNLFANPAFYQNSEVNGANIQDALTLVDSAGENARYLYVVKEWLQRWNQSYASSFNMRSAVNQIFTILFRGHQVDAFKTATASDTTLISRLGSFARSSWMLGTEAAFLQENAAAELARFLQYPQAAIHPTVKNEVRQILTSYSMNGSGSNIWLKAASSADYYGYCSEFNICGFATQLEAQVLSQNHSCSSSMKFRAQQLTANEFSSACSSVTSQESFFHQFLKTRNTPVADDLNSALEMVVFNSSDDYGQYAGLFFGIDTNNGGMYLEGNPASSSNQARFIAYEAEWLRPQFEIWNLTHEMVHYLDGRFNLKGDFGAAKTDSHKTVWWIEGLAEYVSKKNRNDTAIALARTKQFTLSQIFGNTYNSGTDRVYRWGYLAVRFMFETQPATVTNLLKELRAGNYDAYLAIINNLGSSLDSQWLSWLDTVQSNDSVPQSNISETGGGGGTNPGSGVLQNGVAKTGLSAAQNQMLSHYIDVPAGQSKLVVTQNGGTGDADLYVRLGQAPTQQSYDCRPYQSGSNESCTINNPAAGRWYVGNFAYAAFSGLSLTATFSGGGGGNQPNACATQGPVDYIQVEAGKQYCVVAGSGGGYSYFYLYNTVAGQKLKFELYGGSSGNADLYYSNSGWPTSSSYQLRSTNSGNTESISTGALSVGWHNIAIHANPDRGQTTLVISKLP